MTEMPKIPDIEERFLSLLQNCHSETEVTEAYSHCASLILWRFENAIEGKSDAQADLAKNTPCNALGIYVSENSDWTGNRPWDQINPKCAYQVLRALRNCFAHLDGKRVEPKNNGRELEGFTFYLGVKPKSKEDCQFCVYLDFDGLKRLGERVAEL